jgi:hypothetical protein
MNSEVAEDSFGNESIISPLQGIPHLANSHLGEHEREFVMP